MLSAADTVEEYLAFSGNQQLSNVAVTAAELRREASFVAAECHTDGSCPQCKAVVRANRCGAIFEHYNSAGRVCTASGQPFYTAVLW
jgi:hypothetical protein